MSSSANLANENNQEGGGGNSMSMQQQQHNSPLKVLRNSSGPGVIGGGGRRVSGGAGGKSRNSLGGPASPQGGKGGMLLRRNSLNNNNNGGNNNSNNNNSNQNNNQNNNNADEQDGDHKDENGGGNNNGGNNGNSNGGPGGNNNNGPGGGGNGPNTGGGAMVRRGSQGPPFVNTGVKKKYASIVATSLEEWKRKNNIAPHTRIFSIQPHLSPNTNVGGALHVLRQKLEALGWIENTDISGANSSFWQMKFGLKIADLGVAPSAIHDAAHGSSSSFLKNMGGDSLSCHTGAGRFKNNNANSGPMVANLGPNERVVNFFGNIAELTTKIGLQRNVEKFCRNLPYQIMSPSYDMSDKRSFDKFLYSYQRQFVRSIISDLREKIEFAYVNPTDNPNNTNVSRVIYQTYDQYGTEQLFSYSPDMLRLQSEEAEVLDVRNGVVPADWGRNSGPGGSSRGGMGVGLGGTTADNNHQGGGPDGQVTDGPGDHGGENSGENKNNWMGGDHDLPRNSHILHNPLFSLGGEKSMDSEYLTPEESAFMSQIVTSSSSSASSSYNGRTKISGTCFCYLRPDLDPEDPLASPDLNLDELEEYLTSVFVMFRKRQTHVSQLGPQVPGDNIRSTVSEDYLYDRDWLKLLLLRDRIYGGARILFSNYDPGTHTGLESIPGYRVPKKNQGAGGVAVAGGFVNSSGGSPSKGGSVSAALNNLSQGKNFADTQRAINKFVCGMNIRREDVRTGCARPGAAYSASAAAAKAAQMSKNDGMNGNNGYVVTNNGSVHPIVHPGSGVGWSREGNLNNARAGDTPLGAYRRLVTGVFRDRIYLKSNIANGQNSSNADKASLAMSGPPNRTTIHEYCPRELLTRDAKLTALLCNLAARCNGKVPSFLLFEQSHSYKTEMGEVFRGTRHGLDGKNNLWIQKPSNQSRGRGIQVVSCLDEILRNVTVFFPKTYMDSLKNNPLFQSGGPLSLISFARCEAVSVKYCASGAEALKSPIGSPARNRNSNANSPNRKTSDPNDPEAAGTAAGAVEGVASSDASQQQQPAGAVMAGPSGHGHSDPEATVEVKINRITPWGPGGISIWHNNSSNGGNGFGLGIGKTDSNGGSTTASGSGSSSGNSSEAGDDLTLPLGMGGSGVKGKTPWLTTTTASISPRGTKTEVLSPNNNGKVGQGKNDVNKDPREIAAVASAAGKLDENRSPTTNTNQSKAAPVNMIVQKYIEAPQLIFQRKFDIRQWVCLTSWGSTENNNANNSVITTSSGAVTNQTQKNIRAWYFDEFYLRFGAREYDSNTKDPYTHLTNNAVTKLCPNLEMSLDASMWSSDQYREYLEMNPERNPDVGGRSDIGAGNNSPSKRNSSNRRGSLNSHHPGGGKITFESVKRQIIQQMWIALHSVRGKMAPRDQSYEVLGFDFMVDRYGVVWLIEVNTAPDLSFSTSTTRGCVSNMMNDLATLVSHHDSALNRHNQRYLNQLVCQGGVRKSVGKYILMSQDLLSPAIGRSLGLHYTYAAYRHEKKEDVFVSEDNVNKLGPVVGPNTGNSVERPSTAGSRSKSVIGNGLYDDGHHGRHGSGIHGANDGGGPNGGAGIHGDHRGTQSSVLTGNSKGGRGYRSSSVEALPSAPHGGKGDNSFHGGNNNFTPRSPRRNSSMAGGNMGVSGAGIGGKNSSGLKNQQGQGQVSEEADLNSQPIPMNNSQQQQNTKEEADLNSQPIVNSQQSLVAIPGSTPLNNIPGTNSLPITTLSSGNKAPDLMRDLPLLADPIIPRALRAAGPAEAHELFFCDVDLSSLPWRSNLRGENKGNRAVGYKNPNFGYSTFHYHYPTETVENMLINKRKAQLQQQESNSNQKSSGLSDMQPNNFVIKFYGATLVDEAHVSAERSRPTSVQHLSYYTKSGPPSQSEVKKRIDYVMKVQGGSGQQQQQQTEPKQLINGHAYTANLVIRARRRGGGERNSRRSRGSSSTANGNTTSGPNTGADSSDSSVLGQRIRSLQNCINRKTGNFDYNLGQDREIIDLVREIKGAGNNSLRPYLGDLKPALRILAENLKGGSHGGGNLYEDVIGLLNLNT